MYNPFTQKFVARRLGDDAACLNVEYHDAMAFQGPRPLIDAKYRLFFLPTLFATEITAKGEGSGWGFQRAFGSRWYAFMDSKSGKWLSAPKGDDILGLTNEKPGAWEKFEMKMTGEIGKKLFTIKSFHGKYLRCNGHGGIRADNAGDSGTWE